jgi:uncharacterized protein YqhQ
MNEHGEDNFKAYIAIYSSGLRLVGTANATGALAAGAAFQAFEKRPEAQSSLKIIIGFFFAGIVAFAISQMAMFLVQLYMSNYFRRQSKPSDWEAIFLDGQRKEAAASDYLRMVRYDLIVITFSGLLSLILFLFGLWLVGTFLFAL